MEIFQLSNEVTVKTIVLRMKKAESMIDFYKNMIGFILKNEENNLSIFSTKEKKDIHLILEDVSYKKIEIAEEKKLARFTLKIPTEDEFISVLRRLVSFNYPIKKTSEYKNEQYLTLEDPDGNELEILYQGASCLCEEERPIDIQQILKKNIVMHKVLSKEVKFSKIYLNVDNKTTLLLFYNKILGIAADTAQSNRLVMNNGEFSIYLLDAKNNQAVAEASEEQLGVDFFVSVMKDEASILALKKHLEEKKIDFFIDNKQKILTVLDPAGIEWWFVRN